MDKVEERIKEALADGYYTCSDFDEEKPIENLKQLIKEEKEKAIEEREEVHQNEIEFLVKKIEKEKEAKEKVLQDIQEILDGGYTDIGVIQQIQAYINKAREKK